MIVKLAAITTQEDAVIQSRLDWVDNAKALLIFLVVLGHFGYAPVVGRGVIYSFHVPAFLLITGFLLPKNFGKVTLGQLWQKWIGVYVRAYLLFSAIAVLIWWAMTSIAANQIENPLLAIIGSAYGVSGAEQWFVHDDRPLWYFTFLATAMLVAWTCAVASQVSSPLIGGLLAMAYASVAVVYDGPRLPWCLDIAGMGTILIFAGHQFRLHGERVQSVLMAPRHTLLRMFLFFAFLILLTWFNGSVNINRGEFGRSGVIFLLASICGTIFVVLLSTIIPASGLAQRISKNTLTIFALHIYLVRATDMLPVPESFILQQIVMIILASLIVLVCLSAARLLQPVLRQWVMRRVKNPAEISVS